MKHPPSAKIFEFVEMLDRAVKERGALTARYSFNAGGFREWLSIVFNVYNQIDAADAFARFLGFRHDFEVDSWAAANPDIWGDRWGIFATDQVPWGYRVNGHLEMEGPAFIFTNHWRGVAGRVKDNELTLASR